MPLRHWTERVKAVSELENAGEFCTEVSRLESWITVSLFGAIFWGVARLVQSGRQALIKKHFEAALDYFNQAAQKNPNYRFESMHFSQGIWTYVGRTQYAIGRWREARQSLERALLLDKDDILGRLYWGLTLLREGHPTRGLSELQTALQSLHDWLEYIEQSRPFEAHWDPGREIRFEILQVISIAAQQEVDEARLFEAADRVGTEFEEEIDRARHDEGRQRD